MGHGLKAALTSHACMMTHVQRHPTIPMTKRDSMVSNGTRVSLLCNGTSSATPKKLEDKDFTNTNPKMIAGTKRSPRLQKKVKRTDSYKIATNRVSVFDELDSLATGYTELSIGSMPLTIPRCRADDRAKYNTLPRMEATPPQTKTKVGDCRRKHESGALHRDIERNVSQKSGTYYPSPDTDEDQRSIRPDRKKKSAFKRMKERLILTFKKDHDHQKEKGRKRKKDKYKSPSRVKPNNTLSHDAFRTPNDEIETCQDNNNDRHTGTAKKPQTHQDNAFRAPIPGGANASFQRNDRGAAINGGLTNTGEDASYQTNKGPGIFQSIRNSFRRKQAPQKYRKDKTATDSSPEIHTNNSSSQPQSLSSLERDNRPANSNSSATSQPIDIHCSTTAHVHKIEEHFVDADDSITELFGNLIDPEGQSVNSEAVTPKFRAKSRPDTSKLKLHGLTKFKPGSFDKSSPRRVQTGRGFPVSDLSPTVEIDGLDYADAPLRPCVNQVQEESDLEYADVSQYEQQRRVDDVARRLAAIGDSIASRRESESAGSSEEFDGVRVGSQRRRLSQLEEELLTDLRRFGDDIDGSLFNCANRLRFSTSILPIISSIIHAQDYTTFSTVIQREISNTVGWEQVAWYTYLMKTTMDLACASKTLGNIVKSRATHYFSSTIKPWIQSQPNGWESIHEETDIESEVD